MEENRITEETSGDKLTGAYALQKIEELQNGMLDLDAELSKLLATEEPDLCGAVTSSYVTKAEAVRDAIMARETTMQQLIAFYQKVYEDAKPRSAADEKRRILVELLNTRTPDEPPIDYVELVHEVFSTEF